MDPQLLRGGFRIGFLVTVLALITLPFQPPDSAEFVVTVLALIMGALFAALVTLVMRWSTPAIPKSGDKPALSRYNTNIPTGENGRDAWKRSNEGSDTK
jgi:hypothetical protein